MDIEPVIRHTARVLLLDDLDRVLLFRGQDPTNLQFRFWFPTGGGIEAGESAADAAVREVEEETGYANLELGPHIWNRQHVFSFGGILFDNREVWFFARIPTFDIDTSGFTQIEQETVPEHRWWTQDELENTSEILTPRDLATLLSGLMRNGLPRNPVTISV